MELIFATHNQHKKEEIQKLLPSTIVVKSLSDIGFHEDIEETGKTLEVNALIKARHIARKKGLPCFADDSGLEVEALGNAPGVYSARYAGPQKNDDDNMSKLLQELENTTNRKAQFRTVIALIISENEYLFEGTVKGEIITEKRGSKGFGYDPLFVPEGFNQTFAELEMEEKNRISHRAKATEKLISFLSDK